ncbi:Hypothetical protein, putative [Bodo saltans]|uniref:Membrane-associated protein n=1 Tax=Bodo saltans TaxID=75058 RepID=A0A0S4JR80_BODSA|nr:Hypothetical protein, putative [Bodo saltans]|eukprot:CUG92703.1 Hypothetical protein, putative [Bodo saltans]
MLFLSASIVSSLLYKSCVPSPSPEYPSRCQRIIHLNAFLRSRKLNRVSNNTTSFCFSRFFDICFSSLNKQLNIYAQSYLFLHSFEDFFWRCGRFRSTLTPLPPPIAVAFTVIAKEN